MSHFLARLVPFQFLTHYLLFELVRVAKTASSHEESGCYAPELCQ